MNRGRAISKYKFIHVWWAAMLYAWMPGTPAQAQDALFSQQDLTPLSVNPALTGFQHSYRATAAYRSQKFGSAVPFKTAYGAFDMQLNSKENRSVNAGRLGLGVHFISDKAGDPQLRTTLASASLAYNLPLNENSYLGAGFSVGYDQRSIDPAAGKWGSQYNSIVYDPGVSSGERFAADRQSHLTLSAGVLYNYRKGSSKPKSKKAFELSSGLSIFQAGSVQTKRGDYLVYSLDERITGFASASVGIGSGYIALQPAVWYNAQGSNQQVLAGSMVRYTINDASAFMNTNKPTAMAGGVFMRSNDAIVTRLLFEWSDYAIGAAYDIPFGGMDDAMPRRGAVEVALVWRKGM